MIPGALRSVVSSVAHLGTLGMLATMVAALAGGCRGGLGTTCRCAADCRAGLVCSAEGENPLAAELCYKPGVSGLCIESDDVDDSGAPFELTEGPKMDLGPYSKRDFQPSGSISDSVTGTTTGTGSTGSTGSTMTGSTGSTGSTTDATTTDATGTGTSGTSTGTTTLDTTTGTGTTGDSSSTSSSGSSGSSGSSSGGSSSSTT